MLDPSKHGEIVSSTSWLRETALYVEDLERSVRFYQDVLGFESLVGERVALRDLDLRGENAVPVRVSLLKVAQPADDHGHAGAFQIVAKLLNQATQTGR